METNPGPDNPVEAIEETAQATAESIEAVTETITETADESTGEVTSTASNELQDRVAAMEANVQELTSRIASLPGMQEVVEQAAELETTVAETAEEPVHVVVEKASDAAPQRNFFPRWWPKWF